MSAYETWGCDQILLTLVVFSQNFGDFVYKIRGSQQLISTSLDSDGAHGADLRRARRAPLSSPAARGSKMLQVGAKRAAISWECAKIDHFTFTLSSVAHVLAYISKPLWIQKASPAARCGAAPRLVASANERRSARAPEGSSAMWTELVGYLL